MILYGSLGNRLVDEGGIAVTMDGPVFLGTLEVEFFVLGKEHVVLLGKMELELIILLVGGAFVCCWRIWSSTTASWSASLGLALRHFLRS